MAGLRRTTHNFSKKVATERPRSSENQIKFVVFGRPRPRPIACQGRPRPRRLGPSELGRGGLTVSDSIQTELTPLTLLNYLKRFKETDVWLRLYVGP